MKKEKVYNFVNINNSKKYIYDTSSIKHDIICM